MTVTKGCNEEERLRGLLSVSSHLLVMPVIIRIQKDGRFNDIDKEK